MTSRRNYTGFLGAVHLGKRVFSTAPVVQVSK